MSLCRIADKCFLPLYSISKIGMPVYGGEIKHYNLTNGEGTTVALNTFHSPDPKQLISGACSNKDSYEKKQPFTWDGAVGSQPAYFM